MKKKIRKYSHKPRKSGDVPATAGMLWELEENLSKKISSNTHGISSNTHGIEANTQAIKSLEKKMESGFDKVLAEVHRIGLLVEEQNARNIYVLDGYASLSDRLDIVEAKV